jgi:Zn-dependent metalloprotease
VRRVQEDTLIPDREHERLDQYHRGVRVWGADVSRQLRSNGQVVSSYGTLREHRHRHDPASSPRARSCRASPHGTMAVARRS